MGAIPPLCIIRADPANDMVMAVTQTISEPRLDGEFVLLHPVIFLLQLRHGSSVCLNRDGWQQLVIKSLKWGLDRHAAVLCV